MKHKTQKNNLNLKL